MTAGLNYHQPRAMQVCLVHHADAVGPDVDPQRPLSALGRSQAEWLADEVKALGMAPAAIWHSGKLRARQTAEAFLRVSPFAEFKMVRGLRPDDPPEIMQNVLLHDGRDLVVVGHMPSIAALLRMLATGSAQFPLHGLVTVERSNAAPGWTELWRRQPPTTP
jgi:phosphohistidine phosphatase